jgi:hypothetical protein
MKEVTIEILESIVPERIFWRGEELYNEGMVKKVDITAGRLTAEVMGSHLYKVKAEFIEDNFKFSCTCPYEGFCKHSIALGLWMVENKSKLLKIKEKREELPSRPDAAVLLKKANGEQKDKFLLEALNESSILLNRFEVMLKGSNNLGDDIDIDSLVSEIKVELGKFDLEDYARFYDSAPERYGYREEWEVLQDGAEAEFNEMLDQYREKALELLEIHNVIGAFKYVLSLYEATKTADFESINDPACIFEGEGLHYLAEAYWDQLLRDFLTGFAAISFEENVYLQITDIFFNRLVITSKNQIYKVSDFNGILLACLVTEKIAFHIEELLGSNSNLEEEDYCELLLAVHEKIDEKEKWLDVAEKYYQKNQAAAEKLLNHFVNKKDKLVKLAHEIAFLFDKKFIPFFYENLEKKDDPELYKKILSEHIKETQTIEVYKEYKKEYGVDAALQFIDSLEKDWSAEQFYIQLLQEEKAYEKLLSVAKEKSTESPAIAYLRPIVNVYPEQVLKIVSVRTNKFLGENTGRNYYREAAQWLRLLNQITDKKVNEKSTSFINHLMEKYKNRPALKDEFRKVGLN